MADNSDFDVTDLDPECRELVLAMNRLPGIRTTESCCGHGKGHYWIFFNVEDFDARGLLVLSRLMCRSYYPFDELGWRVILNHKDTPPQVCFLLEGPVADSEGAWQIAEQINAMVDRRVDHYNILYDNPAVRQKER